MRSTCLKCDFIIDRCICGQLCEISSKIPIIILRDPKEKKHPLGTAQLLKLCLKKNFYLIDTDDPDQCQIFIQLLKEFHNPILMYPFQEAKILTNQTNENNTIDCLIFLDGTWKKTNRLFFRSQILQKIPRYQLDVIDFKTNYRLRKSTKKISLSTIEAVAIGLSTISKEDYSPLLKTFDSFINKQIELMAKKKGV